MAIPHSSIVAHTVCLFQAIFLEGRKMERFEMFKIVLFSLVILLASAGISSADTHYVTPGQSIQQAINAASNGDQIQVAPGTYNEAIIFNGKAVRLYSSGGAAVTTINGTGHYHVVQCISGEDANTILEGFTITGGNANGTEPNDRCGGGMFNYNSSPTVIACVFYRNSTGNGQAGSYPGGAGSDAGHGGGVYNNASNPTVSNCEFIENSTGNGGAGGAGLDGFLEIGNGGTAGNGGNGAGMYNYSSNPQVINCYFHLNKTGKGGTGGPGGMNTFWNEIQGNGGQAGDAGCGAAMYSHQGLPAITSCTFTSNQTGDGGVGGKGWGESFYTYGDSGNAGDGAGIYNNSSDPVIYGCAFELNKTGNGGIRESTIGDSGNGGGLYNSSSNCVVLQCQFNQNETGTGGNGGGGGAGMYNFDSDPNVSNCVFSKNKTGKGFGFNPDNHHLPNGGPGGSGSGMYNNNSSPVVSNCTFSENLTGNGDGGIYKNSYDGSIIKKCIDGGFGAGIYNGNLSSPIVSRCSFIKNKTGNGGNGFSFIPDDPGSLSVDNGGNGGKGAGMYIDSNSSPVLNKCNFTENLTGNGGNGRDGYIANAADYIFGWLEDAIFGPDNGGNGGNGGNGAGLCNESNFNIIVSDCTFMANKTGSGGIGGKPGKFFKYGNPGSNGISGFGGGIGSYQSSGILSNCMFRENRAANGAGLFNSKISNTNIISCIFKQNVASLSGAGIYNQESNPKIINCLFRQNNGFRTGGGVYNTKSTPRLTNCTFYGNDSYQGSGIYNDGSNPSVTNCILWDIGSSGLTEIYNVASSVPVVTYSDINGGYAGSHNINSNPLFADSDGRLSSGSPCAGSGNNSAPDLPATDLDGNPRFYGNIDMGAFESTNYPILNVTDQTYYEKIQYAINAADDNDEIRVIPGTYMQTVDFKGKAVRLYSTGGPDVTTINGAGNYHVVQCVTGEDANTILEGFTITGGNANGLADSNSRGGGMYNNNSSPTVKNCKFSGNSAKYGGGMFNSGSSPTITNCVFSTNSGTVEAGGMANWNSSSPTVTNCSFISNSASGIGGGMYNLNYSSPVVINCVFGNNNSGTVGGGIDSRVFSNAAITNCTFSGNTAVNYGGGIFNYQNIPTITNCIFWNDSPDEINNNSSSPSVTYSDVKGGYSGTGNINADPCFVNAASKDYRLISSGSPCVDIGNNSASSLPGTDLEGNSRILDGNLDGNSTVDMGAFELYGLVQNNNIICWYTTVQSAINEAENGDVITVQPGRYYENINFLGKKIVLTSVDPNDPQVVSQTIIDGRLAGSVVTFEGHEDSNCILAGFTLAHGFVSLANSTHGGGGVYCYQSSPVIRNCVVGDSASSNWPGGGIYVTAGTPQIIGCTFSNITATATETATGAVVFENGSNVLFQNCTVYGNFSGGSIVTTDSDLTMLGCFISDNTGVWETGGGVFSLRGNVVIDECTITNNSAGSEGGGICCYGSNMTITRSRINGNYAYAEGGGIFGCHGRIEDCVITGNSAGITGGGLSSCSGLINCIIAGNQSSECGGLNACSSIVNCLIINNTSDYLGAGLEECSGIVNCTIIANRNLKKSNIAGLAYCDSISNCIIWNNYAKGSDANQLYQCSVPSYSCIKHWSSGGMGNISSDPCFIDPGHWGDINDINIIVEPNESNAVWVEGSYQIGWSSPCIDAGDNAAVPVGEVNDISGRPRFKDSCRPDTGSGTPPIVDMGAYEFQAGAGGIDGRGTANMMDFNLLASQWMNTGCGLCNGADLTCDGNVDLYDLAELLDYWLAGV